uniref:V-SNARE coiled-coil homology domain-containing protein n=1 Tax=Hyaloperonospora arabidopsidis (strain Emoy2) TaxID=559515 RepID=M4BYM8_HYAAE
MARLSTPGMLQNMKKHVSWYEDERRWLMGHRTTNGNDTTAKSRTGSSAAKDSLVQAQQRLSERGEKLNDLGLKTEQMKKTSEDFYQTMKVLNDKNASKKCYEF